jgi:hypothetical protein
MELCTLSNQSERRADVRFLSKIDSCSKHVDTMDHYSHIDEARFNTGWPQVIKQ